MTQAQFEHSVLQDIGLIVTLATLFAGVFYAWLRKVSPTTCGGFGRVETSFYEPLDFAGCLLVSLPFTLTLIASPIETNPPHLSSSGIVINFGILLTMAGIVLAIFSQRQMLSEALGWKPQHPAQVIAWGCAFYILFFILTIVLSQVGLEQWLTERLGEPQQQEVVNQLIHSQNQQKILLIIGACIIAPFAEEIIFRGYLYPVIKKYTEPCIAILFTGVLFGAIHGEIWAVLPLSLFGIFLAILYECSGSIWSCILCHGLFNSINVFFMLSKGDSL